VSCVAPRLNEWMYPHNRLRDGEREASLNSLCAATFTTRATQPSPYINQMSICLWSSYVRIHGRNTRSRVVHLEPVFERKNRLLSIMRSLLLHPPSSFFSRHGGPAGAVRPLFGLPLAARLWLAELGRLQQANQANPWLPAPAPARTGGEESERCLGPGRG
jgi:hypothetical protein